MLAHNSFARSVKPGPGRTGPGVARRQSAGPATAAACALAFLFTAALVHAQTVFEEVEPNDNKFQATPVIGIVSGDSITGVSTGGSGANLDYFLVQTAPLPFAIYRHRLTITTAGTAGHTGYIRGLQQTGTYPNGGTIIKGTDVQVAATGLSGDIPPRSIIWYGFGLEEQIYYMIGGTGSTTQPYFATLTTDPIDPRSTFRTFATGDITISSLGQSPTADTDLAVFDSEGNAIPGYSNDQNSILGGGTGAGNQSHLVRPYKPGTYYIAITNWNLATNQAAPEDERTPNSNVLDFPNVAVNSQITTGQNMSFTITDSLGTSQIPAVKSHGYEILWFRMDVDEADAVLMASGELDTASAFHGEDVLVTVLVTPASDPASTGIVVTADLTELGGSASQPLDFDHIDKDGRHVYTYLAPVVPSAGLPPGAGANVGPVVVSFEVTDEQDHSASGFMNITLFPTVQFTEVEPNDSKDEATFIDGMAAGDTLSGVSTSSTGEGLDYYRIKTVPAPLAIYRHRLRLTWQEGGIRVGTIRGLTQSGTVGIGGSPNFGTDAQAQIGQASQNNTLPPRTVQWYGFGKEEELYYRVTGAAITPQPYYATMFTDVIEPVEVPGNFEPGEITITTVDQGHNTSTHLWVYDGELNAIPTYGNRQAITGGSQSLLVRDYAPGTYHLALTTVQFASNQPAAFDDNSVTSTLMDFPNIAVNTGPASNNDLTFSIIDSSRGGGGAVQVSSWKDEAFQIQWFRFVVGKDCAFADLNCDGSVGVADLLILLAAWGPCADCDDCPSDLDGSCNVGVSDLLILLANWG